MRPIETHKLQAMLPETCSGRQGWSGGYGFDSSGDGADWSDHMVSRGWQVPGSWGRDGWDVGDWPYQLIAYRKEAPFFVMTRTEGDLQVVQCDTLEEAIAKIDWWVATLWRAHHRSVIEDPDFEVGPDGLPTDNKFRGPFSWARLDAEGAS